MHICFPFRGQKFVAQVVEYIERYQPALTIINSTVAPGTSRRVAGESGAPVVNSPIRGKHARMQEEMLHYTKFIGALDPQSAARAVQHFQSVGIKTKVLSCPEASEVAKLTETTYFGLLIAWAQEVEGYCKALGADYDEVFSWRNWWALRYAQYRDSPPGISFRSFAGYRAIKRTKEKQP